MNCSHGLLKSLRCAFHHVRLQSDGSIENGTISQRHPWLIFSHICLLLPLSGGVQWVRRFSAGDGKQKKALIVIRTPPSGSIAQDLSYRRKYDPVDKGTITRGRNTNIYVL